MADARRLAELGMVPALAKELAAQITAGVGNLTRLAELTMVPRLAREVVAQIATPANATVARLAELGMVPVLANEVVAQIKGAGVPDQFPFVQNGVNVTPFLVSGSGANYTIAAFDAVVTPDYLADIVAAGFDHVRFDCDPWPALNAADSTALASVMAITKYGIDKFLAAGLKVVLCSMVYNGSAQTVWTVDEICGVDGNGVPDGHVMAANGPKFQRYKTIMGEFANLLLQYPSSQVAFEQWNEIKLAPGLGWPGYAKQIYDAFYAVNKMTSVYVSAANYAGMGLALRELLAQSFGPTMRVAVHNYDLQQFSHQGLQGTNVSQMSLLEYPPVRSWQADQLVGVTEPAQQGFLDTYYKTALGKNGAGGDYQDWIISNLANADSIASLCTEFGVNPNRVLVTEMGVHGDYVRPSSTDRPGATRVSMAAWLQDVSYRHEKAGHGRNLFAASPGVWSPYKDGEFDDWFMAALNRKGSGSYDASAAAYFAAAPQPLSDQRKLLVHSVIQMLKNADGNAFGKMDFLFIPAIYRAALGNKATALIDLKNPARSMSEVAGGTFLDNRGYAGDGAAACLDVQYALGITSGSQASQNDIHIGVYQTAYGNNANGLFGNSSSYIAQKFTSGEAGAIYGSCAGTPGPTIGCRVPFPNDVHVMFSRSSSTEFKVYQHGGAPQTNNVSPYDFSIGTKTANSQTLSANSMTLGKVGSVFSTARAGIMHGGASLSRAAARDVNAALRFLMQGLERTA